MIAALAFALLIALALVYVMAPLFESGRAYGSGVEPVEAPPGERPGCAACGAPAAGGARFCARCGAPLSAPR